MKCVVWDNAGSKEMKKGDEETSFRGGSESARAFGRNILGWEC